MSGALQVLCKYLIKALIKYNQDAKEDFSNLDKTNSSEGAERYIKNNRINKD